MARTDPAFIEEYKANSRSQLWRVSNLYRIKAKEGGEPIDYRPNPIQHNFYTSMWARNVVLKPRGVGSTTMILVQMLDSCFWVKNFSVAIVAHTEDKATEIFQDHIQFMYEHFEYADIFQELRPGTLGSKSELVFANGSRLSVQVSLRSGSYQSVVSTELGHISNVWPDKAKEFKSGGLPTARDEDAFVFIESTGEGGPQGVFYETCRQAREETAMIEAGKIKRGPRSYRFHFFPWFDDPRKARAEEYPIPKEDTEYFAKIERELGITLSNEQKWWYCETANGPEGLARIGEMHCNYPSTFNEAFESFIQDAYFTEALNKAAKEGRIGTFKYDPMYPVDTWWDLGLDCTAIWCTQTIGNMIHCIWYYENINFDLLHYVDYLSSGQVTLPWPKSRYGKHVGPHDVTKRDFATKENVYRTARRLGFNFLRTARPSKKQDAIQAAMIFMARCRFDKENCAVGLQRLQKYRPRRDQKDDIPSKNPRHDLASHGSAAFETLALYHDRSRALWDTGPTNVERETGAIM